MLNPRFSPVTLCASSEQKLADDIWPAPLNRRMFGQLAQPFLASLLAAGHDIVEARKTPDKVRGVERGGASLGGALWLVCKAGVSCCRWA